MRDPHVSQKQFVMACPELIVWDCENFLRFSSPRMYLTAEDATMNADVNAEAVIFRQSVQWQTKTSIRPGAVVGWSIC
jgi:hypothetical protein